jgi:hypothetical protein
MRPASRQRHDPYAGYVERTWKDGLHSASDRRAFEAAIARGESVNRLPSPLPQAVLGVRIAEHGSRAVLRLNPQAGAYAWAVPLGRWTEINAESPRSFSGGAAGIQKPPGKERAWPTMSAFGVSGHTDAETDVGLDPERSLS